MTTTRKRSRPDTEKRFRDAVLELIGESGCADLGVNLVAQRAGSDKVLIYRYFEDFEGLLTSVASSRHWLLKTEELVEILPKHESPLNLLRALHDRLVGAITSDPACLQILNWRHAVENPVTQKFSSEWETLWSELATHTSEGRGHREHAKWKKAFELLASMVAGSIQDEAISWEILETFAVDLELPVSIAENSEDDDEEDVLPTNLL